MAENKIDYNKDKVVDSADSALALQDKNKDGKVTQKEKDEFRRKQGTTTQTVVTDPKTGKQTVKTTTAPTPEPALGPGDFGYNEEFLKANPDIDEAIRLAIQYNWSQEVLNRYIENQTEFGKRTTDTQAQFDINIVGDKKEDLERQITDRAAKLKRDALAAGVTVSDDEINTFARESVRSGLTDQDTLVFLSTKFTMPGMEQPGQPKMTTAGQSAMMVDEINAMARNYGIKVTDQFIQEKVREGMQQGSGWQAWLEGQRNVFREQAKLLYPKVADKFDQFTLGEMLQPYLNDASDMLGINLSQMNYDDPMWTAAVNGPDGALSRDEWLRVLRTDKKYGWDGTLKARAEMTNLADDLLSVFGMA